MLKSDVIKAIKKSKIIAVIRGENFEEALDIANSAFVGGINIIEITYTIPSIDKILEKWKHSNAIIGAGTVLDVPTARDAILKGSKFVVSPHFNEDIAKLCNRYSILYIPGCMTIKEVINALEFDCNIIKLFPANAFNPTFIKSIKGPLPNVEVIPTGGINKDNANKWLKAGAFSVGVSSDLTNAYNTGGEDNVISLSKEYGVIAEEGIE